MKITLGEETIGLKYNMGAFDIMTADKPDEPINVDKGTKDISLLIYAGMFGNCLAKKEEPKYELDDVKKMIKALDYDELEEIAKQVKAVLAVAYPQAEEVSGEGNADTQPKKVLNVA